MPSPKGNAGMKAATTTTNTISYDLTASGLTWIVVVPAIARNPHILHSTLSATASLCMAFATLVFLRSHHPMTSRTSCMSSPDTSPMTGAATLCSTNSHVAHHHTAQIRYHADIAPSIHQVCCTINRQRHGKICVNNRESAGYHSMSANVYALHLPY